MKLFIIGLLVGVFVIVPLGVYLYVRLGFLSLATTAHPLPLEEFLADTALHESVGDARKLGNPLPATEENLLAGAREYRRHCAVCHGLPGQPKPVIGGGEFPPPPQFFEPGEMITEDPEGASYWKISNGIRLSGMPRFNTLPETERWQLAMLIKHADKLPQAVGALLRQPLSPPQ